MFSQKNTFQPIRAAANTVHLSHKWCHPFGFTKKSFQVATSSSPPQSLHPKPREARLLQQTSKDLEFRSTMSTAWPPQKDNRDLEQAQHGGCGSELSEPLPPWPSLHTSSCLPWLSSRQQIHLCRSALLTSSLPSGCVSLANIQLSHLSFSSWQPQQLGCHLQDLTALCTPRTGEASQHHHNITDTNITPPASQNSRMSGNIPRFCSTTKTCQEAQGNLQILPWLAWGWGLMFTELSWRTHQPWPLPPPLTLLNNLTRTHEFLNLKLGSSLMPLDFKGNIPNCTQSHMNTHEQHPLSPFLVHTWSRPAEALSLFCRSRGSRGGYTTAACRDRTYGTETQEKSEGTMLRESSHWKLQ